MAVMRIETENENENGGDEKTGQERRDRQERQRKPRHTELKEACLSRNHTRRYKKVLL